jgi:flagellar basal-body rod protein FlgC
MNLFGALEVSGSAMKAERIRAEVVAANMANAETTRTADGTPYRRQHVVFSAAQPETFSSMMGNQGTTQVAPMLSTELSAARSMPGGVDVSAVVTDPAGVQRRYDPQHPDADKDGYVAFPDINPLTEMVDLMGATRAYGLNSSAVQATKSMISSSLDILK